MSNLSSPLSVGRKQASANTRLELMRILIVNPNTSHEATHAINAEALRAASATTEVIARTAPRGPLNIGSDFEIASQVPVVLEMLENGGWDAAIIAAYGDPGLELARKYMKAPVVGIGEASMKEADRIGSRIAIVSSNPNHEQLYRERAAKSGIAEKIIAIRYLRKGDRSVVAAISDRAWLVSAATEASRTAIEVDNADVIVIAGGPLAGIARAIRQNLNFAILDPVACAVGRIERWVRTGTPDL